MNGENWVFQGYLPDRDDIEAEINARDVFFSLPPLKRNQGEALVDYFSAGFIRGLAWGIKKKETEQ